MALTELAMPALAYYLTAGDDDSANHGIGRNVASTVTGKLQRTSHVLFLNFYHYTLTMKYT
jgi:hypothetical protein